MSDVAKTRLPISLCAMIKDEAEFLDACLHSSAQFFEELVIFDTGSSDSSCEIANRFRNQVPSFIFREIAWSNHFAEMRNQVAKAATQPWIFFIDGDEVLDRTAYEILAEVIGHPDADCYSIIQRNYTYIGDTEGAKPAGESPSGAPKSSQPLFFFENWMERLYRPSSGLHYEGRIHESLLPSARKLGLRTKQIPLILHHFGRLKSKTDTKLTYYLELTQKKFKEEPLNPAAAIELILTLSEMGNHSEAYDIAALSVEKFATQNEILKTGFHAALRAEKYVEAEVWIRRYLERFPNDLETQCHLTTALLYQHQFDAVLQLAESILRRDSKAYIAHINLAVVHFQQQSWQKAKLHIQAALQQKPNDDFLLRALAKVNAELH